MIHIASEALQWLAIAGLLLLTLAVYQRDAQRSQGASASLSKVTGPPVGSRVPAQLREAAASVGDEVVIAFATESCTACRALIADLTKRPTEVPPTVLVLKDPSAALLARLKGDLASAHQIAVMPDDGQIWDACHVTATPLLLRIDERGRVTDKAISHEVRDERNLHPTAG